SVLVRRTIQDLNLGARVVVCPTVRDDDGLALSSRNQSLTPAQRRAAPVLYAGLQAGQAAVRAGVRSASLITRIMRDRIATEPLARVEYLSVCDPRTLEPLSRVTRDAVLLGAIRLGRVRLIDNLLVRRDK
ncbi:MAG: pantoate--beta-alanine ligase, partial [Nitrospiraceae bacterium]